MEADQMQQGNYDTLIRKTYGDFEVGDLDLLKVVMADDVVWHEPGRNPLAGDHRGPDGVLALLAELKQRSGDTFQIEVLDVFSNAERAVVLQRETASSNGKSLDVIAAVEFEIHHGKVTEATVFHSDAYQFDAFWSDVS